MDAAGETSNNSSRQQRKKRRQQRDVLLEEAIDEAGSRLAGRGKSIRALRQQAKDRSYDESLIDQMLEKQLGTLKKKKRPVDAADKDVDVEAMISAAIGFPETLTDEEIEAGVVATVGGEEQANYVIVRNHILARWRENVNVWLEEEKVMETIRSQHKSLVRAAYKFLLSYGYINFGIAPAMKSAIPKEATKCSVVIIGAGLAGLAAARQLMALGHKVVVVEGRHRPGGRVYTKRMEGGGQVAAADLGGSVVTGMHGNPLGVIARQLGLPLHKIRDKCPLYQPGGADVNEDADLKVEGQFNKLLDLASKWREKMEGVSDSIALGTTLELLREQGEVAVLPEERQLFDWHLANLEYANAGLLSKLSLAFWDQDDPYEMGGDHCFVPGGNVRLITALAEDVPIFYGKTVHTIRCRSNGVQVLTADQQLFEAEMALCTVPLGVLKQRAVTFEPELPARKYEAVDRLGFGLLNKVAMLFPFVFWGSEVDTFGQLTDTPARRGEFFLFYSYAAVSGGPLLIALVAGEAAIKFEGMPPLEAIQRVLGVLRGIYQSRGVTVPDPIQTVCTRWGSDPLCYGSYSNVAVGASGDDYDILSENVGGQLFFAGEATTRRYPATMHGAFLTGLREAGNIAAHAAARSTSIKVPKDVQSYAAALADIFREPDVEFGNFALVYDPQSQEDNALVLLRVNIGNGAKKRAGDEEQEKKAQQHQHHHHPLLHLYTVLTRQQALELREVRGGDRKRLLHLCKEFGVKLVGRRGLGAQGDGVIAAIKWSRSITKSLAAANALTQQGIKTTNGN